MKLVNCTPGDVILQSADGTLTTLPKGTPTFVVSLVGTPRAVDGIHVPVRDKGGFGKFTNLPVPAEGVLYVVNPDVARAMKSVGRTDMVFPTAQDARKLPDGKIAFGALRRI